MPIYFSSLSLSRVLCCHPCLQCQEITSCGMGFAQTWQPGRVYGWDVAMGLGEYCPLGFWSFLMLVGFRHLTRPPPPVLAQTGTFHLQLLQYPGSRCQRPVSPAPRGWVKDCGGSCSGTTPCYPPAYPECPERQGAPDQPTSPTEDAQYSQ